MKKQIVIILGATGGLGSAIARTFSQVGDQVILVARDTTKLTPLTQELDSYSYTADITNLNTLQTLRDEIIQKYGHIDIVINATGSDVRKPFEKHTSSDMRQVLEVNLLGAMQVTHTFLPVMKEGVIVQLGGFADGRLAFPYYTGDVASRAGVATFVEALNRELRLEGKHTRLLFFSPAPADTDSERPFHTLWRQMGTKIVSPEQVGIELRRAIIQKKEQYIMGGFWVNLFAKLNAAFPKFADMLLMNQYGQQLQNFFSVSPEQEKSSLALKIGMTLIIFSIALYGVIFSLPFVSIHVSTKLTLTPILIIVSEIVFWVGGILAGKEVVNRYRQYLNPCNWCI